MSKIGKLSFLFGAISMVSLIVIRYLIGEWVPFCWVALGLFVFFMGLGIFWDRRFFKDFLTMKTTKHGMNMGVLILLMIALLAVINYLGAKYIKTWDFSVAQTNTLSPQSIQLVQGLTGDLKVHFFYKKGVEGNEENRRQFRELIKRYQDKSTKIHLDFVEVNERPDLAKEFGVDKGSGVVFLEYKGRKNRIEKIDEQEFTSALVKVTREQNKTIYFTIGHGEKSLEDAKEGLGLGSLKLMLENNRYTIKTLPLSQEPKIPSDADVIVIAGPVQNFQGFEITALEEYLKGGGGLLLALESQNTVGLEKLMIKLGIQMENNYVMNIVETILGSGVNQGPTMGALFSQENKITASFAKGEITLFRFPSSLRISAVPEGVTVDELVKTGGDAMSFRSLNFKDQGPQGSYTLVAEAQGKFPGAKEKSFHLIVAGDMDFLSNQMLYQNLNRDLVLNSIAALAKEENLISITPKEPQATQMIMTETKFGLFLFGFIIPLPLILLGISIGLWYRRRNA
jgi:ABC-type uncharacterized transport system involved in gliding motility auxiliary subunit